MSAVLLLLLLVLLRLVVSLMLAVNGLLFPLLQADNKSSVMVVFKLYVVDKDSNKIMLH